MAGEWMTAGLGEIVDIQTGRLDSNHADTAGVYPFFTCAPQPLRINQFAFDCDAVLLAGNNANGVFHLNRHSGKFNAYQRTYVITAKKSSVVDTRFLYYLLHTLTRRLGEYSQGTATKFLTMRILAPLPCLLPPVDEQRAIADILGTLDDKIELNRQMNETLEAMAQALFKSWFVDFDPVRAKAEGCDPGLPKALADLFPESFEGSGPGEIPKGWEAVPLPQVIDVNPPRTLRNGEVAPYLDMVNMPTRGHSPDRVIDRPYGAGMRFANGDTLVARLTPCLENGKTAYVDFLNEGEVGWGSTEYIVLHPKLPLPAQFGYCLARSDEFRAFAIQRMTGSSGRQRVPAESLFQFLVASPPEMVALSFGRFVTPLFARASATRQESRTLAALRDTLLPKLISGELRIKDAERFLADRGL